MPLLLAFGQSYGEVEVVREVRVERGVFVCWGGDGDGRGWLRVVCGGGGVVFPLHTVYLNEKKICS